MGNMIVLLKLSDQPETARPKSDVVSVQRTARDCAGGNHESVRLDDLYRLRELQ